jgi:transcriptional regulator with XRE-family HTH domain
MDIDTIIDFSPDAIAKGIAARVKMRRLERGFTQKAFARRAGVGYDAYRRFENTGETTLRNLVLCAMTLDEADSFKQLFTRKNYRSIDEVLQEQQPKTMKQRGTINE